MVVYAYLFAVIYAAISETRSRLIEAKKYKKKAAKVYFALGLTYFNMQKKQLSFEAFMQAKKLKHKNADSWLAQLTKN